MAEAARRAGVEALVVAAESAAEAGLGGGIEVIAALIFAMRSRPGAAGATVPGARAAGVGAAAGPDVARCAERRAGGRSRSPRGAPQPAPDRAARIGQDHAGPAAPGDPAAARAARVARDHPHPLPAGLLAPGTLVRSRPFRAPHHSASAAALIGNARLRPGEVSLAHGGVLFMDELPEFTCPALEGLRMPLEERRVHLARAHGAVTLPRTASWSRR